MIQDQLSSIVRKFKQNEYYQYSANKQNNYRRQSSKIQQNSSKQQVQSLSKKLKYLQNVIEKMIIDGNKMHRYYEELLIESAMQFQTFKQEYNGYRCSTSQQKKQGENLVQYLSAKIDTLSRQISNKQELYRQLLQKYEQLEERAAEAHLQESAHVKDIQKQLAKESMHREEQRMLTTKQIQQMKQDLEQAMEVNEQLLNQNNYLKNMNESLAHNIEYLKNKLYAENNIIHQSQQQYQENHLSLIELERCEVDSISREEDRLTLDQIKMNQSQQNIFNGQKQVLNLSEHYSKFNRTQQFLTKQKSNYQFVMMESNQRKSFAKRKELISQNKNVLIKIDSIESKDEEPNIKSRHITEIKQFKMQQTVPAESIVDPYKAFFLLLTQCEKMNSPYFEKISHIDLTYLYPQLIKAYIPYNKWQDNIRNELLGKVHKK